MRNFEVASPILNSPFEEPREHWWLQEGEAPQRRPGRRIAHYFWRDPKAPADQADDAGVMIELKLVSRIRAQLARWRPLALRGDGGVSRTTAELLAYWRREGRRQPLFFAQIEAAEAIIFLTEGRADFLQGIAVPREELSDEARARGYAGFVRQACKMATGSGKSTVMAMLAAWSILNKAPARGDARFSDVVLIVCPNVTIRDRLGELDPGRGAASLYRTRDLVPEHLMPTLTQGKVVITNWHVFEPQTPRVAGDGARVIKAGVRVTRLETIHVGDKTTTARGKRYLKLDDLARQVAAGILSVREEVRNADGSLRTVKVVSDRYVESDTALVERVLGRDIGGKRNILVLNDEAHHAYRIERAEPDEDEDDEDDLAEYYREATVWIEGLDRIARIRGVNRVIDFSATPYYLGRVGAMAHRPFPWIVSDFSLIDAIESGLVKIPQLAVRDSTGASVPGYFNIWRWILPQLTPAERGGRKAAPKPEAILKYAHVPIAMLAGLWREEFRRQQAGTDRRPPVFILVCKNTKLAAVLFDWIANDSPPGGIPRANMPEFTNRDGTACTIRVDSKVIAETDTGAAKNDEARWMRFTLDTVGKLGWPRDGTGREMRPDGFEELAAKLGRPPHPPGRDVRCIVSVGMLTEGWDCSTVTHIVGLRPFMSQLLCEQVVGRGLRRISYNLGEDRMFSEEVATVFGVPFQVVPFKANPAGRPPEAQKRWHVHALPERANYEIRFPRVEGYTQRIRDRIDVVWDQVPALHLNPLRIPPEVEMRAALPNNRGRPSVASPGRVQDVSLDAWRRERRDQELVFEAALTLARDAIASGRCALPSAQLFPQMLAVVRQFVATRVKCDPPYEVRDLFLAPFFGWMIETLLDAIRPADTDEPEVPRYEARRGPGSTAEVDFWTSREPREVARSHLNYVVPDTKVWEQSVAFALDHHQAVDAFVKNAGLGFAIPYLNNGEMHDYVPDFVVRLAVPNEFLILETKGFDPTEEHKAAAARRWVSAINRDGRYGRWRHEIVKSPAQARRVLDALRDTTEEQR